MGTQNRRFEPIRSIEQFETYRQHLQSSIDAQKTISTRRQLGQFSTPTALAREIVNYGLSLLQKNSTISFLEPAVGTGAFFSALMAATNGIGVQSAVGYELDPLYGEASRLLWQGKMDVRVEDFTKARINNESINLLLTNPPYVRHHYISSAEKTRLAQQTGFNTGRQISGLSGLYCYFILQAHKWLSHDAISGWLIPSEFMDVNYGSVLKKYLLEDVQLLRIHRYNPQTVLFDDALVSSCVVWFRKQIVTDDYEVEFSYGGSHEAPEETKRVRKSILLDENKWTRFPCKKQRVSTERQNKIKDFFMVKRGIATGDNGFFILTKKQIDSLALSLDFFKPILPSPRYLKVDNVPADSLGYPLMDEQYFLLNCTLPEEQIIQKAPALWEYLQSGKETVAKKYLCASRKKWYYQENRQPAPLLCTYMGRNVQGLNSPFHFIVNHTNAVATNSYLMMYPNAEVQKAIKTKPSLLTEIWQYLNSISPDTMESEGRVYGGGLKKIEPKELLEVPCPELARIIWGNDYATAYRQISLWDCNIM